MAKTRLKRASIKTRILGPNFQSSAAIIKKRRPRAIKEAVEKVAGAGNVKVVVTHTPPFSRDMLSEEAKLILNL